VNSDNNRYRALFERSADAILIIDGDRFVDCNQATVDMLRYETKDELLRTHPSELSPEFQPDGRLSFEKANEMMALAASNGNHRFEWDHRRADGEVFPVEVLLDALEQLQRGAIRHVDLLLSDVVMPNMSGPAFAAHFAKLFPRAKVLFSSGHTRDLLSHDGTLIPDIDLLRKPYRKKVLLTRVRELLDQVVDTVDEG